MVFQHFNLFQHLTVRGNITLASHILNGLSEADASTLAEERLEKAGFLVQIGTDPSRLSGGQKQRVAIARALPMKPKVTLFDEATLALDPEQVEEVNQMIKRLAEEHLTMMIVTHEMDFAAAVCDRVIYADGGVVVEEGPPSTLFKKPRTRTHPQFLRKHLARNGD